MDVRDRSARDGSAEMKVVEGKVKIEAKAEVEAGGEKSKT